MINKSIISPQGEVEMIDPTRFIYQITLDGAQILLTDSTDINTSLIANANNAIFYLDFSDQVPSLTNTDPVNLSSSVLRYNIRERQIREDEERRDFFQQRENLRLRYSSLLKERMKDGIADITASDEINRSLSRLTEKPIDFYAQYYKAELTKKYSLSLACFFLTLVALPLGMIKVKYGKLTGFALSLIIAVSYWYLMFFSQLKIFDISSSPYLLILAPDLIIGALAFLFFITLRRVR